MKKYILYAIVIGFLGNSLLSVASQSMSKTTNRTAIVLESVGG